MDTEEKTINRRHSIFWPLMLVAVGVVLLLTNLNAMPGSIWDYVAKYWPLLFILGSLDQIYQGKNWVGAMVLLALGGVLLAGNLNALPWSGLDLLLRLWPVLIVAAGLDLMMRGRTSMLGGILVVLLAVALMAGMIWVGFAAPGSMNMNTVTIDQPLEGAQSASVNMTVIAGELNIAGGADRDQLIGGQILTPGNMNYTENYSVNGGEGRYELEPASGVHQIPLFSTHQVNASELMLNGSIPTTLDFTLIAGEQSLDLRSLKITNFETETIFGQSVLTLPASGRVNGKTGVIFGQLVVRVPRGVRVEFRLDTALVGKDIPQDFIRADDRIYSPEAANGKADVVVILENVFGAVKIEYIP